MAVEFITWAVNQKVGNAAAKAVLLALCNYADKTGYAYPSQKLLVEATELSLRTVQRAIEFLEEKGIIRRQQRRREDGYRTSDAFYISRVTVSHDTQSHDIESGDIDGGSQVSQWHTNITTNVVIEPSVEPIGHLTRLADEFEQVFWPEYPRKEKRKDSEKAYIKARNLVSREKIMHGLAKYKSGKPDYADWRHATTWLNGEGWNDEYTDGRNERFINGNAGNKTKSDRADEAVAAALAELEAADSLDGQAELRHLPDLRERPGGPEEPGYGLLPSP